ncbi:MAG TPA: C69 family dipeptidase [Candidatus Ornithospirochaeta stercorigallinarum]|nr:C69 family dipeptidase [Candidatus Ornithospirochaeta stercorigallinarum]
MKKAGKILALCLVMVLIAAQSLAACTIFAVGKDASTDGTTMISHTCDSTTDDLRVWIIPEMAAGTARDLVLNGRAGADYSQFPEVKNYGPGSLVLGTYTYDEPTNQYLHAMYSFINDKGLAMGESTCSFDRNSEQGKKLSEVYDRVEGIIDCYLLQDLALEKCSTAREAVEFMGEILNTYGWNGTPECINITDGTESWIFEAYGGNIWCAVRVPDNAVFVAANRARINHIDFNDNENYIYAENIVDFAIENGLWDGEGEFIPCKTYAPNPERTYSTRREWMAMTLLDPTLDLDPEEKNPDENWPLFVVPQEKVSVDTIHKLSSNYYQGTPYDVTKTVEAGAYGNPLNPRHAERTINCFRCTYIQIATIDASLPEEVRCLAYFGWGAPDSTYLTPVWASQNSLPEHFGIGLREEPYNEDSGWWVTALVQQTATINYQDAIQTIHEARDQRMADQYVATKAIQQAAAEMVENGESELAVDLLTAYSTAQANTWHDLWKDLSDELISTYMHGNKNMSTPDTPAWWDAAVAAGDAAIKATI